MTKRTRPSDSPEDAVRYCPTKAKGDNCKALYTTYSLEDRGRGAPDGVLPKAAAESGKEAVECGELATGS